MLSPGLGILTWSLTRDALRARSGLDTVHDEQKSLSVSGRKGGKKAGEN